MERIGTRPPAVRAILLLIIILIGGVTAHASYPLVTNYPRKVSGGGSQTWGAAQDSVGRMYFCNKDGLLTFNSDQWQLYSMPHGATLRSCLLDARAGRLYVGSSDEFGYFSRDKGSCTLTYHSVSQFLKPGSSPFNEVWRIHQSNNILWFRSDHSIFRFDGRTLLRMQMPGKVNSSAIVNGLLYVALEGRGIFELRDRKLITPAGNNLLKDTKIIEILPYKGGVMAVTADKGLYVSTSRGIRPLATDIDPFLKENQVFCAAESNGIYAFGTILNGVVVKDIDSGATRYANLATGLQNNTVLSLFFDEDQNIWAGLDDGIDLIKFNSPFTNLLSSAQRYGAGYMSLLSDGTLYLGTNQGLFLTNYPTHGAEVPAMEPVIRGQVWNIGQAGSDIVVSSDNGLYYGRGSTFTRVEGISGSWDAQELVGHPDYLLVSGYDAFHVMKRSGTGWTHVGTINDYNDIGGHFMQDADGSIWLPNWLRGIYRLKINPEECKVVSKEFYNSTNGLPTDHNNGIARVNGSFVFPSEGGIHRFDGSGFHLDRKLSTMLDAYHAAKIVEAPTGDLWCLSGNRVTVATQTASGAFRTDSTTYAFLAPHLIPGFENLNFLPDDHLIVSSQEGFLDVNLHHAPKSTRQCALIFDRLYVNGDSLAAQADFSGNMPSVELHPGDNTVRFRYILPDYGDSHSIAYSYCLENYDNDWSNYSANTTKEYTHLKPGNYKMKVRATAPGSSKVYEASFPFTVLPPWYLSVWAKIIYLLLTVACFEMMRRVLVKRMARSARRMAEKKQLEIEAMKRKSREETLQKDFEIAHLKSEQLESDVKHKAEELSSLTMNIVRKNEMLQEISNRLKKIQEGEIPSEVNRQINKLHGIIRENISHDDDWKNFVHNFDAAYEDFTKKLTEKHPGLTVVELRTCCYIKMGLSSKDIAPLFNISYRSVEMTRYRLRKKLGLERSANLTEYLSQF